MATASTMAPGAKADAQTAYTTIMAMTPTMLLTGSDLGGMTLYPGVYKYATSGFLTGTLTLDAQGDASATFSFQVGR